MSRKEVIFVSCINLDIKILHFIEVPLRLNVLWICTKKYTHLDGKYSKIYGL